MTMRNKGKDLDDYSDEVYASKEEFFKHHRVLEGEEREALKQRIAKARGKSKDRVTIFFDSDIVRNFKERSEREGVGYQTLMNEALRTVIEREATADLKEDMLKDKKFLKRLKSALSA